MTGIEFWLKSLSGRSGRRIAYTSFLAAFPTLKKRDSDMMLNDDPVSSMASVVASTSFITGPWHH